jgi:hypothetical protein
MVFVHGMLQQPRLLFENIAGYYVSGAPLTGAMTFSIMTQHYTK